MCCFWSTLLCNEIRKCNVLLHHSTSQHSQRQEMIVLMDILNFLTPENLRQNYGSQNRFLAILKGYWPFPERQHSSYLKSYFAALTPTQWGRGMTGVFPFGYVYLCQIFQWCSIFLFGFISFTWRGLGSGIHKLLFVPPMSCPSPTYTTPHSPILAIPVVEFVGFWAVSITVCVFLLLCWHL